MKETFYLNQPIPVRGSEFVLIALSSSGKPYMLREKYFTGLEDVDMPNSFPALPYLIRKAEAGEDVPDFNELENAIRIAKALARRLYRVEFPSE